jgi:hypothetical protein
MSLEAIVLGIFAILIGLAFVFAGFRFFLILLPIWGFFAGFVFGADIVTQLFGNGFLATTTSWVVGFVLAVIFAVLSYLYYWFAVIFLGASAGYALGIGLMAWLGLHDGFLVFLVGVVVAIGVALAFIVLRVPKYLILGVTAFGGAFATLTGVALILGRIPKEALAAGIVGSFVNDSLNWVWVLAALVLGIAGFVYQMRTTARVEAALVSDYRNPGLSS